MDMERVLKGSLWTFNNHLLILYKLKRGEDTIRVFLEYDGSNLRKENRNYMRIDIRKLLKRKKQVMCCGLCSYVKFKYECLSLFCFYCERLGHNDSFCEAKMMLGVDFTEMGWDLSLRAQFRRALSMNKKKVKENVKEGGQVIGFWGTDHGVGIKKERSEKAIDPILGFNIEGGISSLNQRKEKSWSNQMQTTMEHDLEDDILIGEEGKK
ncbi:hypothetical protein CXB51_003414 [Gossypium anomalum]|uniref:Zinc knuckle CX2CX4HX4C domain-containing protein n=1 Tax=Gossypium anomalum TaxID=47600 RepID=A0A8J6DA48_9ROSI|nr:hypothetical protein CXB51_003414 [Gossypium anomalum]